MKQICLLYLILLSFCIQKETLSGGATTSFDFSLGAFGRIARNVNQIDKVNKFNRGSAIFKAIWQNDQNKPFYGLGPLFNSSSCASCHTLNARGRNILPNEKEFFSMSFKFSNPNYGKGLQLKSIDDKKILPEVNISVTFEEFYGEFPDGEKYSLRKPIYKFENWNYGVPNEFRFSARVAPVVYGLGLLSLIPKQDLKNQEDVHDKNKDGISGKLNIVDSLETNTQEIGRFGWKAGQPSLKQFIATALLEDIGITSEIFLTQNCTEKQTSCNKLQGSGIEIDSNTLSDLVFYIQHLAVPARRNFEDQEVQEGKKLFFSIGCENCHKAEWKTENNSNFPELSNQTINPYTDLLLHDMGTGLADGFQEFLASGEEWRTPPLWGLGLYSLVSQHSFLLHDGRARDFQEAILWHDGEAKTSKENYIKLNKEERKKVLKFLESL